MVRARERDPVTNGALTGSLPVVRAAAYVGHTRLLAQNGKLRHDGGSMMRSMDASLIRHIVAALSTQSNVISQLSLVTIKD
jgi:hypothetical protein